MNSKQIFRPGIVTTLTFMLLPVLLIAQNSNIETVEEEIALKVLQQTGYSYHILAYKKGEREPNDLGFDTTNTLLDDIYIFVANAGRQYDGVLPNGFIGMYKNRNIIWQSEKEINTLVTVAFFTIGVIDINSDDRIEIITQWYQGMQGENTELWIYSWDGFSGERIHLLNEEGKSQIRLQNYSIQLVDFEPDGIKEIIGVDWDDKPVAFQWNGLKYIKSMTAQPNPLPRNALDATLSVQVDTIGTKFRYNFSVFNSEESLQSIEEIAIRNLASAPTSVQKPNNWNFNAHLRHRLVSWDIRPFLEYHREALLTPGEGQDTLSFISDGLPRPASFYLLGNNGDLMASKSQLINNSFNEYTLGPWLPDSSMSLQDFTDTLETFRLRSCEELGWATDAEVCGQLKDDLSEIKTALQDQDSVQAANVLSDFIKLVEQEKDASLTSEGYALLYFNAEYLAERLPQVGRKED
jgi:hypothetical protein